jgi:NADH-quinone oxidoreductase subunit N
LELELTKLVPEIIVLIAACVAVMLGLSKSDTVRKGAQWAALLGLALAFVTAMLPKGVCPYINNQMPESLLSNVAPVKAAAATAVTAATNAAPAVGLQTFFSPWFVTALALGIGLLSVLAAWNMPAKADPSIPDSRYRGEFYAMMLFSIAGVSMAGKVNDLIWLFVVLELVSIPTYILVATSRSQIVAQEAGVKYFFLGALSAAIYLFGFSYIYGATGATRFVEIQAYFSAHHGSMTYLSLIGVLMVVVGVSYKMAAVPLHFYAPDVYQGAATPVTAFLAFAPKTAGLIAIVQTLSLFKFDFHGFGRSGEAIHILLTVMAVLTMTVGNVLALLQRNIKRMLAYSSIAHSGYMLVGVVVGVAATRDGGVNAVGIDASLFYLAAYAIMNLGAFAVLIFMQGKADAGEDIDDLAGISKEHPAAALAMAICLFSLIGMPGTVGFIGKLKIVQAALSTEHPVLAVIVVINAAIGAAYYLRIIAAMYLRDVWNPFAVRKEMPQRLAGIVCTLAVLVFGIIPIPISMAVSSRLAPAETAEKSAVVAAPLAK